MKNYLRSTELARLTGVSTDTLRFYERKGLLPMVRRSTNGYREYAKECVTRVNLIQAALSLRFSIRDLSEILRERDNGGIPCQRVRQLAESKLKEMDQELERLKKAHAEMKSLLQDWNRHLKEVGPGKRAGLLEKLSTANQRRKK